MQKVSKQSLAMIALSILLAISIALTFTFALTGIRNTATGTITFTGNASILINGQENAYNFNIKFDEEGKVTTWNSDGTQGIELNKIGVTLGSGSTSTKIKAAMTFEEPDAAAGLLKKYVNMGNSATLEYTTPEKVNANDLAFNMNTVLSIGKIDNSSQDFATLTSTDGDYRVIITITTVDD